MTNPKDYLSQEEIDALLRQSAEEPSAGDSSTGFRVEDYLSPIEQDALGEIGNITFGSAATALSSLLGRKVDITTPVVSVVPFHELANEFPKPHVAVHVKYVEGLAGINLLVIKTEDAQVIADLMLGGEGKVSGEELNEIHISAVQEAMNQMMGSSATSMSTIFNRFVNISPPGINILDVAAGTGTDYFEPNEVYIKVSFRITIGDLIDSTIMQLLPVDFAKEMVSYLMGGEDVAASSASQEPPVPQPEPQAVIQQQPVQTPPETAAAYSGRAAAPQQPAPQPQPAVNRNLNVQPVQYPDFGSLPNMVADEPNLNLLLDIPLKVTVELGRTKKLIRDILELSQGSIIELDKLAGEPVDILANNKLIAKGEVVVIDENFGVRVTEIVSPRDRLQNLQ
jgi:flagellar motor switch protein FliN